MSPSPFHDEMLDPNFYRFHAGHQRCWVWECINHVTPGRHDFKAHLPNSGSYILWCSLSLGWWGKEGGREEEEEGEIKKRVCVCVWYRCPLKDQALQSLILGTSASCDLFINHPPSSPTNRCFSDVPFNLTNALPLRENFWLKLPGLN